MKKIHSLQRTLQKSPAHCGALVHVEVAAQARKSSDNPMLNAFWRVAPSLRFKVRAILGARFFLFARLFNVRTSSVVQARCFDFLAIQ
jgi:hypothetical protein